MEMPRQFRSDIKTVLSDLYRFLLKLCYIINMAILLRNKYIVDKFLDLVFECNLKFNVTEVRN